MSITNNLTSIAVTGTADSQLIPPTGYVKVPFYTSVLLIGTGLSVANGEIVLDEEGYLDATGYIDTSHSANNAHIGIVFGITVSGNTVFSDRSVHSKNPNSDDFGHLAGTGLTPKLPVGSSLSVYMASDVTGDVTPFNSTVTAKLLKEV